MAQKVYEVLAEEDADNACQSADEDVGCKAHILMGHEEDHDHECRQPQVGKDNLEDDDERHQQEPEQDALPF